MRLRITIGASDTDFATIAKQTDVNRRTLAKSYLLRASTFLCVCLSVLPFLLWGQTNSPAPAYSTNRFLMIVETSRAMQRRSQAMTRAVRDLLTSGLSGQARRGDSIGVWTFNEELYAGLLPVQQWSTNSQKAITDRIVGFITAQKLEKGTRFDKVLPALDRVVKNSPFITVIIVCLGDEDIHGTPFDQRISEFFRTWHLQQQDAGTPFVIALRAQNGKFVDCAMNPSPWPAELPALPRELMTPLPVARPVAKDSPKPATSVPPLILSGKKHEPTPLKTESAPTNIVAATQSTTSNSAQSGHAEMKLSAGTTASAPDSATAATPPVTVQPTPLATTPQTSAPLAPIATSDSPARPSTTADPKPGPALNPQTPTIPVPTPAHVNSQPETLQPNSAAASPAAIAKTPGSAGQQTTPIQVGSANATAGHAYVLWGAGLLSLSAAVGAVWFWRRRSRPGEETSLITESIHRDKKQ